jgi:hypothetical protein
VGVSVLSQVLAGRGRAWELYCVVVSLVFLAAGICAVWFVQGVLDLEGDAMLVALLVAPVVLYLTLSGRVREFAAGSLSVKLNAVSREPIKETYVPADLVLESDPEYPDTEKTDPNRPQVATLTSGHGEYERVKVLDWLRDMAVKRPVPLLIIRGDHGQVLAFMTYRSAIDLLERDRGDQFIQLVNGGDPHAFDDGGGFSAVRTETLRSNDTNEEALATMEETGLDTLVVVDRTCGFQGIVERDRVLSRMMLAARVSAVGHLAAGILPADGVKLPLRPTHRVGDARALRDGRRSDQNLAICGVETSRNSVLPSCELQCTIPECRARSGRDAETRRCRRRPKHDLGTGEALRGGSPNPLAFAIA